MADDLRLANGKRGNQFQQTEFPRYTCERLVASNACNEPRRNNLAGQLVVELISLSLHLRPFNDHFFASDSFM